MSKKNEKIKTYRGELALLLVVLINSFGARAISLGTWTYIFQTLPLIGCVIPRISAAFPKCCILASTVKY